MRSLRPVLVAALAAFLPACGHRGDPLPPRRRTPPTPQQFRIAQRGDALEVRATAPSASVDGVPYEALTMEFLWAEGQQALEKGGRRRAVKAAPGARVVDTLPLPTPGTTVRVAARAEAGGKEGQRTLTAALVAQAPLEPPGELKATLAEDGVALSWRGPRPKPAAAAPALPRGTPGSPTAPTPPRPPTEAPAPPQEKAPPSAPAAPALPQAPGGEAAVGAKGEAAPGEVEKAAEGRRTSGFFVYRRLGAAPYDVPLVEEPLERRALSDALVPTGTTACYVVRAVASTEPLIESAPSNEACAEVCDVAAPAAPAGIAVLPREGGLEILWSPSREADLAGYRVYRAGPDGAMARLAEVEPGRAAWLDETARRGTAYRYSVAAFDRAGNESERAEPVEASLP